ncbi:MAG: hypothetical protein KDI08_09740, partial [Pseudomonadales bacterium]|nr:hypothetical protein [Pseudomonadales bacterium]
MKVGHRRLAAGCPFFRFAAAPCAADPDAGHLMATAPQTFLPPLSQISGPVAEWVESIKTLTRPRSVHWCEGSDAEYRSLIDQLAASGELQKLNPETFPNCYLARSNPSDVARVEHLTFVCTSNRDDAGPNNNWMAP